MICFVGETTPHSLTLYIEVGHVFDQCETYQVVSTQNPIQICEEISEDDCYSIINNLEERDVFLFKN